MSLPQRSWQRSRLPITAYQWHRAAFIWQADELDHAYCFLHLQPKFMTKKQREQQAIRRREEEAALKKAK